MTTVVETKEDSLELTDEQVFAFMDEFLHWHLERVHELMRTPKNEGTEEYKELQDLRWWLFQRRSENPFSFENICQTLGLVREDILDPIESMYPGINPIGDWLKKAEAQFQERLEQAKTEEEAQKLFDSYQLELDAFYDQMNDQMSLLEDLESELAQPTQPVKRKRGPYKKRCPEEAALFQQADLF